MDGMVWQGGFRRGRLCFLKGFGRNNKKNNPAGQHNILPAGLLWFIKNNAVLISQRCDKQ